MGTVAYCPPEQISRGNADARSDVYSSGVVLFELLTGSTPYLGDSAMAVAYQHVNSDVPAPSSRRPGIPTQLDDVVRRATSREPSGRPLDAGALLAELHDVRVDLGLPVVGVPPKLPVDQPIDATQPISIVPGGHQLSPISQHPEPLEPTTPTPDATTAPTQVRSGLGSVQNTVIGERPVGPAVDQPIGAHQAKPPKKPLSRKVRARRRTTVVVVVVLLLGALTGYGAWWFAVGRYHQVPNTGGMSQSAATKRLVDAGFTVNPTVARQYSENAAGTVLATDPGAGSHVLNGKVITLIVSRGADRFTVPAVSGTFQQAQRALQSIPEVRVVQSLIADETGKTPAGQVLRTDPPAASTVPHGQVVTVFVSTGPPVLDVPDVKNRDKNDADSALTKAGFKTAFTEDFSDTVPEGKVISQSPDGGTAVKFSTVNMVVSKGKGVAIPPIPSGSDAAAAKASLEDLGFDVKINKKPKGIFDFSGYTVDRVDPPSGTVIREGSKVALFLR
jgi:serine/threonine-protein kinase